MLLKIPHCGGGGCSYECFFYNTRPLPSTGDTLCAFRTQNRKQLLTLSMGAISSSPSPFFCERSAFGSLLSFSFRTYIQSCRYYIGSNEKRTFPKQRSIEISREETHLTELPDLGKVPVLEYINTTVFIRSRISTQRYSDILYTNFLNTGQSSQERFFIQGQSLYELFPYSTFHLKYVKIITGKN